MSGDGGEGESRSHFSPSLRLTIGRALRAGASLANGRAAAQVVWAGYFADPSFQISWKSDRADVAASGDIGFTSGAYQLACRKPDGAAAREVGEFLCVWRKQADGSWKAVHEMWNSDAP